ncbi:hypothetical protein JHK85_034262 [Glycine max]|nr:hypothetical protein JHK85_034262 [Glycine max]
MSSSSMIWFLKTLLLKCFSCFQFHSLSSSNTHTHLTHILSPSLRFFSLNTSNGHISNTSTIFIFIFTNTFKSHSTNPNPTSPISLSSLPSLTDNSPTMTTRKSLVLSLLLLLGLSPLCAGAAPPQELWCVAKNNAEDAALQRGGPCYDPTSVQNTASFSFNDYFLKHGMTDDSCNFNNNAAVTSLNPSHDNCKFPSGKTGSNGSFSGSTPTSSVGLGPSEDFSGCTRVSWGWWWFWPLSFIGHLMFMVSVFG